MDALLPGSGISLATGSVCPGCQRPLLGFAMDACGCCGFHLEGRLHAFPEVILRMHEIARSWTPEAFLAWARHRPAQLLWTLRTGHWRNLGYWVAEDLWRLWARQFASLKGRMKPRLVDELALASISLYGIGEFAPWVKLRIRGARLDFQFDSGTRNILHGNAEPTPFHEIWTFMPTGQPIEKTDHQCGTCAGGLDFKDIDCPYCGCPVIPEPGPWLLVGIRPDLRDPDMYRSPFDASAFGFPDSN
jgi:hypothetical protein